MLWAAAKPVVYVISAGGMVLRRLVLETPSGDGKTVAMRVAQSQIAVQFWKPASDPSQSGHSEFVVYDAFRGEKLTGYTVAPNLHGIFACFDGRGGFDFLGTAENGTRTTIRVSAN